MPATITVITQDDASQVALAVGPRRGASLHNASGATVYVALDAEAALDAYTVALVDGAHYEVPWSFDGSVHVIWAAAGAGLLMVTEQGV